MLMKNTRIQEEEEIMEMNEFVPFDEWEVVSNEDISTNKMPFRLGIEFETGNLLSYEICDLYAYHKEPLFTCTNKEGKKLWHFELDCNDIEIVTVPFSQSEIDDLKECSATINNAFTILKKLVNDEGKKNTLREWFEKLKEDGLILYEEELFKKLENEFILWKNGTQKWEGFIQPHSTIQMPLEYVVELSFELFKNDTGTISIFEASLPFKSRENFEEYFKKESYESRKKLLKQFRNKIDGLMFLQAETLFNITLESFKCKNNVESIKCTFNDFMTYHQVCPKMYLHIMSRRPYSDMLHQLDNEQQKGYSDLFKNRMKNNLLFMNLNSFLTYYNTKTIDFNDKYSNGVPEYFEKAIYADKYTEGPLEKPKNLTNVFKKEYFEEEEIDEESLNFLLQKGIVSTSILRGLKKEVAERLNINKLLNLMNYNDVVNSVENTQWRPIIKIENDEIRVVENNSENDEICKHDFISPFLASSNNGKGIPKRKCDSMGSYQNSPEELKCNDFGEAIIEIRAISFAHHEELGNRIIRNNIMMPNLFLSEIEYIESDFLSLFNLIGKTGND